MPLPAALLAVVLAASIFPNAPVRDADVLVQAGHEGRPASCARFPGRACNLGAAGERALTPVVADEVARRLRAAGLTVARVPADYNQRYRVRAAIFIHFDGAQPPCSSSASIGYPPRSADAARAWRAFYGKYFPFQFMPDNFTRGLSQYYAYRSVEPNDDTLLLELGEITCPAQRAWLMPRIQRLGDLIARFVIERLQAHLPEDTM